MTLGNKKRVIWAADMAGLRGLSRWMMMVVDEGVPSSRSALDWATHLRQNPTEDCNREHPTFVCPTCLRSVVFGFVEDRGQSG